MIDFKRKLRGCYSIPFSLACGGFDPAKAGLQQASLSSRLGGTQWCSQKPFKPFVE
jgi:hypothetical protein